MLIEMFSRNQYIYFMLLLLIVKYKTWDETNKYLIIFLFSLKYASTNMLEYVLHTFYINSISAGDYIITRVQYLNNKRRKEIRYNDNGVEKATIINTVHRPNKNQILIAVGISNNRSDTIIEHDTIKHDITIQMMSLNNSGNLFNCGENPSKLGFTKIIIEFKINDKNSNKYSETMTLEYNDGEEITKPDF